MTWLTMFFTSFVQVALKAFQQLNVMHDKRLWVPPTSMGMGLCLTIETLLLASTMNFWLFIPMGLGGAAGCTLSMELHKRLRNES